jgi:hypothetical protein
MRMTLVSMLAFLLQWGMHDVIYLHGQVNMTNGEQPGRAVEIKLASH